MCVIMIKIATEFETGIYYWRILVAMCAAMTAKNEDPIRNCVLLKKRRTDLVGIERYRTTLICRTIIQNFFYGLTLYETRQFEVVRRLDGDQKKNKCKIWTTGIAGN